MEDVLKIINERIKNNEYINEIEEICVLLEIDNISFKQRKEILEKILEHNSRIHKSEKERANQLANKKSLFQDKSNEKKRMESNSSKSTKSSTSALNCDVTNYFNQVYQTKELDKVISFLPKKDDPNFDNIVGMILVRLEKEYTEIYNFIKKQKDSSEYQEIFDNELQMISSKKNIILDYQNYAEEIVSVEEDKNKIAFLKNSSGIPTIFQDIEDYKSYYPSFLELLNSIISGKFKRKRGFNNHNKIKEVMEVRGTDEARLLYARLSNDTYAVLGGFIKKCNTDIRQLKFVISVSREYEIQKQQLLCSLENESFMQLEQEYLTQLTTMLSEGVKVKK